MKRKSKVLIPILMLATTLALAAQDKPASGDVAQPQAANSPVYRSIEGCLAFNGVSYVLAVVSNGPKQYRVVGGDTALLQGKLGHTVEIDGMTGSNNPTEMIMNWDQRQATTGVGWYTISADRVRDVTSNCSYPGFEHPLSHVTMN